MIHARHPLQGVSRLNIRKTLYSFSSVTRVPVTSFQASLYSILPLHPPARASPPSVPGRRDLRTRTRIFWIRLGRVSIPLPSHLLLTMISAMISSNQGTPLEIKNPPPPSPAKFPFRKTIRKDPTFISTGTAPPWVITEFSKRSILLTSGRFIDLSVLRRPLLTPPLSLLLTPWSPLPRMIIRYLVETEGPLESGHSFTDLRILDPLSLPG